MKHLFIPYELAVIAKEKGFNEPCFAFFLKGTFHWNSILNVAFGENLSDIHQAPTYQQIEEWLMNKHDLFFSNSRSMGFYKVRLYRISTGKEIEIDYRDFDYYKSFNKAIEEAFKAIEGISNLPHNEE